MAKHAKPTFARTLKKTGARTGATLALATVGLLSAGPAAFAADGGDEDETQQVGLVNLEDSDLQVPIQVCNNNVSVLAIQDVAVNIPIVNDGDSEADSGDSCKQPSSQDEDD